MATEVFALGYVAWLIQHPSGYFLSGYIDGRSCRTRFSVTTSRSANRLRASYRAVIPGYDAPLAVPRPLSLL